MWQEVRKGVCFQCLKVFVQHSYFVCITINNHPMQKFEQFCCTSADNDINSQQLFERMTTATKTCIILYQRYITITQQKLLYNYKTLCMLNLSNCHQRVPLSFSWQPSTIKIVWALLYRTTLCKSFTNCDVCHLILIMIMMHDAQLTLPLLCCGNFARSHLRWKYKGKKYYNILLGEMGRHQWLAYNQNRAFI